MSNPYEGGIAPKLPKLTQPPSLHPLNLKPYNFEIKDYDEMKNLLHCNTPIGEPIIKCPDFHIQLDHTLAVLWMFYSDHKNWCKLTTTHLEWAIRFIDGVLSLAVEGEHNDVAIVKKHLEELLIVYYAEMDVNKFCGETGRVTALPVVEQTKMDLLDPRKILETINIQPQVRRVPAASTKKALRPIKASEDNENMIKQLSDELAYIKFCRAKIRKTLKSSSKVNRLAQDLKTQVADIKQMRQNFLIIKNASSFIFINNLDK